MLKLKHPKLFIKLSKDGTRKWVFRVGEGAGSLVETAWIPAEHRSGLRRTLCISSQVGCALDCSFCSTGAAFNDLTPDEIIGQLWVATILIWKMFLLQIVNVFSD